MIKKYPRHVTLLIASDSVYKFYVENGMTFDFDLSMPWRGRQQIHPLDKVVFFGFNTVLNIKFQISFRLPFVRQIINWQTVVIFIDLLVFLLNYGLFSS